MTIVANTTLVFDIKGVREKLFETIYNISPEDTPFLSNAGRASVDNTLFEWQRDSLAAAVSTNAQLQGDDVTSFAAVTATVRVRNRTQISTKAVIVDDTTNPVTTAGRTTEIGLPLAK